MPHLKTEFHSQFSYMLFLFLLEFNDGKDISTKIQKNNQILNAVFSSEESACQI